MDWVYGWAEWGAQERGWEGMRRAGGVLLGRDGMDGSEAVLGLLYYHYV